MNKRTPVSAYRLVSCPSIKQKLYVNSRRTPCITPKQPIHVICCSYSSIHSFLPSGRFQASFYPGQLMVAYNSDSRYLNFLPGNAREMVNKLTRACAG